MKDTPGESAPYALVVDDDGLIRMDAIDILADAGFRTLEASDGDKAMVLLAERHAVIVLLFTDVQMPGSRNGSRDRAAVAAHRHRGRVWSGPAGTRRHAGRRLLHRQAVRRRDGARPPEGHPVGRPEA